MTTMDITIGKRTLGSDDILLLADGDWWFGRELVGNADAPAGEKLRGARVVKAGTPTATALIMKQRVAETPLVDRDDAAEPEAPETVQAEPTAEQPAPAKRTARHTEVTRSVMERCPAIITGDDRAEMLRAGVQVVETIYRAMGGDAEGSGMEFSAMLAAQGVVQQLLSAAEGSIAYHDRQVGELEALLTRGRAMEVDGEGNRVDPRDTDRAPIWGLKAKAERQSEKVDGAAESAHRQALMLWGAIVAFEDLTGEKFRPRSRDRSTQAEAEAYIRALVAQKQGRRGAA